MAERHTQCPSPRGQHRARGVFALACASLLGATLVMACAGSAATGNAPGERYPEKKRPEPLRSASDGEVMGAQRQSPADTLEGSLTNEHPAPRSPHTEAPTQKTRERLEYERCLEARKAATDAEQRKQPECPPPGKGE